MGAENEEQCCDFGKQAVGRHWARLTFDGRHKCALATAAEAIVLGGVLLDRGCEIEPIMCL